MRIKWTKDKVLRIKEFLIAGHKNFDVAKLMSEELGRTITIKMIENVRHRNNIMQSLIANDPKIKVYDDFLKLSINERWLICCDVHAPYHSPRWINRTLLVAEKEKCDHILIAGDLFEMGFAKHWLTYEGEKDLTMSEEVEGLEQIFKWLDYFKKIYLIRGNHESRVTRLKEAKIQAGGIIKLMTEKIYHDRFKYSYYDKAEIGDDWLAIHPKSYSQISASTAVRLTEKFHKHILNAHGHFFAVRYDRSGKHMGIDLGGLFDVTKIGYKTLQTTTHPEWQNAFATLIDNHINFYWEGTNWEKIQ